MENCKLAALICVVVLGCQTLCTDAAVIHRHRRNSIQCTAIISDAEAAGTVGTEFSSSLIVDSNTSSTECTNENVNKFKTDNPNGVKMYLVTYETFLNDGRSYSCGMLSTFKPCPQFEQPDRSIECANGGTAKVDSQPSQIVIVKELDDTYRAVRFYTLIATGNLSC